MKSLTTGKIVGLCMGDFARGMINGIVTTYLLTFFLPTSEKTTLPQFFLTASLVMAIIRGIGTVVDAITDPWVANLTDNCKHKLGRRIPLHALQRDPLRPVLSDDLLPSGPGHQLCQCCLGGCAADPLLPVLHLL